MTSTRRKQIVGETPVDIVPGIPGETPDIIGTHGTVPANVNGETPTPQ